MTDGLNTQAYPPGETISRRGLRINLHNDQRLYLAVAGELFAGISMHPTNAAMPLAGQTVVMDIHPDIHRGLPPVVMIAAKAFPKGATLYGAANGLISDEPLGFSIGEARSASAGFGSEVEVGPAGAPALAAGGYPLTGSESPPSARTNSPAGTSATSSAEVLRIGNPPSESSGAQNMRAYQRVKTADQMSPSERRAKTSSEIKAEWELGIARVREEEKARTGNILSRGHAAAKLAKQDPALHEMLLLASNSPKFAGQIREMFDK